MFFWQKIFRQFVTRNSRRPFGRTLQQAPTFRFRALLGSGYADLRLNRLPVALRARGGAFAPAILSYAGRPVLALRRLTFRSRSQSS